MVRNGVVMEHTELIYDRQGHAFRLKLEFDLILRYTTSGEYRYFRHFQNESLFERHVYNDLNRLSFGLETLTRHQVDAVSRD